MSFINPGLIVPMVTNTGQANGGANGHSTSGNPMCIYLKDHGKSVCESLQVLRMQNGLVDLDLVCENQHIQVHKVVMAAASKFFKTQLCKAKVMVPVILQLEDFDLKLTKEALSHVVDFIYRGEVVVPSEHFNDVCHAAHALGVTNLTEFLPNSREEPGNQNESEVPVVTIEDNATEEEVHHVVVSIPSHLSSSTTLTSSETHHQPIAPDSMYLPSTSTTFNNQTQHHHVVHQNSHSSQMMDGNSNVMHHGSHVDHHQPPHGQYLQANTHFHPQTPSSTSHGVFTSSTMMTAIGGQEQQHMEEDLMLQNGLHLTNESLCFPSSKGSGDPTLSSTSSGKRIQALKGDNESLTPGYHPSPGKLRVINQGSMNNVAENIQSSSKTHTPTQSDDEDMDMQSTSMHNQDFVMDVPSNSMEQLGKVDYEIAGQEKPNQGSRVSWLGSKSEGGDWNSNNDDLILYEQPGQEILVSTQDLTVQDESSSYTGESWTPSSTASWTVPPPVCGPNEKLLQIPTSIATYTEESSSSEVQKPEHILSTQAQDPSSDRMLAIRSGVPLALQNKKKKQSKKQSETTSGVGKGDFGVRKDLTLPSAKSSTSQVNVFEEEEDANGFRSFPVIRLDDSNDCELVIHGANDNIRSFNASTSESAAAKPASFKSLTKDYQCVECTMEFEREHNLRQHVRHAHQKEDTLCCPVCKMNNIKGKESLKMHLFKDHGLGEIFRCEECSFTSSVKASFIRHMSEEHEHGGSLKCQTCDKSFKSKTGYKQHLKKHANDYTFECTECDFGTAQKLNLVKHMASKHKKDIHGVDLKLDLRCDSCNFVCHAEYQLKSHQRRKHGNAEQKRFQCKSCDYSTVDKQSLETHTRFKHTNERPFMCNICGFSTCTASSMTRHKQSHANDKPYKCDECNNSYADKKRLQDHKLKHLGVLPFKCDFCSFRCRRKDNLKQHISRQHLSSKKLKAGVKATEVDDPDTIAATTKEDSSGDKSHIVGHINQDGTIRPVSFPSETAECSGQNEESAI